MGKYLVSAEASFSAAHTLAGVDRCDRMHGHDWRVRLTVEIPEEEIGASGMELDFRTIEALASEAVADFDHRLLNELEAFKEVSPTAERVALEVSRRVGDRLKTLAPAARLHEVEVWETPTYRVVYRP
jgi:6-pyruvoyltetrahydropterin/6-carboxytetrahydropterin synthase